MLKATIPVASIHEENWKVSDKIKFIKNQLQLHSSFALNDLFANGKTKLEIIVTFLALLELLKLGLVAVGKINENSDPIIFEKAEG